jgi:hypothetical protein
VQSPSPERYSPRSPYHSLYGSSDYPRDWQYRYDIQQRQNHQASGYAPETLADSILYGLSYSSQRRPQ